MKLQLHNSHAMYYYLTMVIESHKGDFYMFKKDLMTLSRTFLFLFYKKCYANNNNVSVTLKFVKNIQLKIYFTVKFFTLRLYGLFGIFWLLIYKKFLVIKKPVYVSGSIITCRKVFLSNKNNLKSRGQIMEINVTKL